MVARLANRISIVTGAGSGIGREIASALSAAGSRVVGLDVRPTPGAIDMVVCDVTDADSVDPAVSSVVEEFGRVDVLVNAAGTWLPGTVDEANSISTWDSTMAVNARGVFLMSRAVVPSMIAQRSGSIIHIGSISGIIGNRGSAAYSASKGAVISLTRAMAVDYGHRGVRVNCVCPGITRTPMLDATEAGLSAEEVAAYNEVRVANTPLGRLGTPADVAPGVVFLASDDASWISGSCLTIDGGYLAGR